MADNVNIIVQDTINDIVVNAAVVVETIDINVQAAVDVVDIVANPNNYVVNINRIIGEQVQSDWDQNDNQAPDYIKNKPSIPTLTSDLTNDGEDGINPFITAADVTPQVNSDWDATTGVAEILNKPTIPAAQVNSDWDATSGLAQILNKPTLATVATSGSYTDLINKPTIPAAVTKTSDLINDGENGINPFITAADIPPVTGFVPYTGATANVDLGTHTLSAKDLVINHSSGSGVAASITKGGAGEALTINKTSGSGNAMSVTGGVTQLDELHLTTDLADSYIASAVTWNGKQAALVSGTNIKTINGSSVLGSGDLAISGSNIYNADGSLTAARTLTLNAFPLTFVGTTSTRFYANGNIGINQLTDAGFKLDVNGTTRFQGISRFTVGGNNYIDINAGANASTPIIDFFYSGVVARRISIGGDTTGLNALNGFLLSSNGTVANAVPLTAGNINSTGGIASLSGLMYVFGTGDNIVQFAQRGIANRGVLGYAVSTNYLQIRTGGATSLSTGTLSTIFDNVGSVGIGGITSVNASAILQTDSTTKGFLPPRMTTTQKNAITTPAAGLVVYDTTLNKLCVRTASSWETITSI
jgi:hypothetical protein